MASARRRSAGAPRTARRLAVSTRPFWSRPRAACADRYVVTDDWYARPDAVTGRAEAVPRKFPSGTPRVPAEVHAAGYLFGVRSAASVCTCGSYTAPL